MNIGEYASNVGMALRNAHNAKNMADVQAVFAKADEVLAKSKISPEGRKAFWTNVRNAMFSAGLLTEKQANSSLIDLMNAIEKGIKDREAR